jgi:hypothetical protein
VGAVVATVVHTKKMAKNYSSKKPSAAQPKQPLAPSLVDFITSAAKKHTIKTRQQSASSTTSSQHQKPILARNTNKSAPKPLSRRNMVVNPNAASDERFIIDVITLRRRRTQKMTPLRQIIIRERVEKWLEQQQPKQEKRVQQLSTSSDTSTPSSPSSMKAPISSPITAAAAVDVDLTGGQQKRAQLEQWKKAPKLDTASTREYGDHIVTAELNESVKNLLHELHRLQERVKQTTPNKLDAKRRYVVGLREVSRLAFRGHLKCVIMVPNIEAIEAKGIAKRANREEPLV